jgi:uncharacterized membrane protein
MKHDLLYHFFSDDDFLRISNKIGQMEKNTSGEIRVSIKEKKPLFFRKRTIDELAKREFFRLKMDKTRDKTGTLIFIILKEREFHILGDTGINEKIGEESWHKIKDEMQQMFRKGLFCDGVIHGVETVGLTLQKYFPVKEDDTNELPDTVVF